MSQTSPTTAASSASSKTTLYNFINPVIERQRLSLNNEDNYPEVVYNVVSDTINILNAAEKLKDRYLLDRLASLYLIPFSGTHLKKDRNGDLVWLERFSDGSRANYEQMLSSAQFLYGASKLLAAIVHTERSQWTGAMYDYWHDSRGVILSHLDRWMNKKSMWAFPECVAGDRSIVNPLFAYTFPEYVEKKRLLQLGTAVGYCNMANDIELLVAMSAAYAVDIQWYGPDPNWLALTASQIYQYRYYVRSTLTLFEDRLSYQRSSSPLCGGACDALVFDVGGRHGYWQYPQGDWPNGGEVWDIGHGTRIPWFIDTVYARPEISVPSDPQNKHRFSLAEVSRYFANTVAFLMFSGDFRDPSFNNFINGSNVPYQTRYGSVDVGFYRASRLSGTYYRSSWSWLGAYSKTVDQINQSIADILQRQSHPTWMVPETLDGGHVQPDLAGFYSGIAVTR